MTGDLGKIRNPERASQLRDYTGLCYHGNITPSDIDGAFEINNRMFVFLEYKFGDAAMPKGQELFLERLADSFQHESKPAIVIEASHNHPPGDVIDCANATVTRYRWRQKWVDVRGLGKTVRVVIDGFHDRIFGKPVAAPIESATSALLKFDGQTCVNYPMDEWRDPPT